MLYISLFSLGLDEITSERESLSKQRKAAAKATEEQKKQLTDEDEDYEPKLTPGCHPVLLPYIFSFCLITDLLCCCLCFSKIAIMLLQIQEAMKISVNQLIAKMRNSQLRKSAKQRRRRK